jgi:hypothetical protein
MLLSSWRHWTAAVATTMTGHAFCGAVIDHWDKYGYTGLSQPERMINSCCQTLSTDLESQIGALMLGKPRRGTLMAVLLGALVAAVMTGIASAPVARADDPFTDIFNAVQGDFSLGQEAFTLANVDFANGDVADGLAAFYGGVDDDLFSVPNNLLQGSLAALIGEPIDSSLSWTIPAPADFNDAVIVAPTLSLIAEGDLHTAVLDLAGGDIAGALDSYLVGYEYLDVVVPELFIVGSAAGFGL